MGNLRHCVKHIKTFLPPEACKDCARENDIQKKIEDIEGRFYAVTIHEQLEQDVAWLTRTLKRIIKNGKVH